MRMEEIEKTTYRGEQWPRDATEAAGETPPQLDELELASVEEMFDKYGRPREIRWGI